MSQTQQTPQLGDPIGNEPEQTEKEVRLTSLRFWSHMLDEMHLVQASESEQTFPEITL